ncbi:hypothetical protein BDV25DRAFT_46179 [Aspergillus avenaceus]|uniref:Cyanovirin-N domain-containing protein n=1 Tax=Aspergillus avenaceus TaxID=36643 RepID=A0A5N6TK35_ASPAV|nr:hypothetical protein BDV25DRAFT_46179 [Aspergillus avenaceus]
MSSFNYLQRTVVWQLRTMNGIDIKQIDRCSTFQCFNSQKTFSVNSMHLILALILFAQVAIAQSLDPSPKPTPTRSTFDVDGQSCQTPVFDEPSWLIATCFSDVKEKQPIKSKLDLTHCIGYNESIYQMQRGYVP